MRSGSCATSATGRGTPAPAVASVGPPVLGGDAVAALRPVGADRQDLETVGPALECAHRARGDAHDVPPSQAHDVVVELDPARPVDHDVDLLLLAMAVTQRRAKAGPVAEVADP